MVNESQPRRRRLLSALAVVALACAFPAATDDAVKVDDHDLENAIEDRLDRISSVDDEDVDVFVEDGVVKLDGSVGTLTEKHRAVQAARSFRGVRGVTDDLKVKSSDREDAAVRDDVVWMLTQDPMLNGSNIQVAVDDGHVQLTGAVDSYTKKDLARDLVQGIAGVTAIDNNIQLAYQSTPSDTEIQERIARNFNATRSLADDTITVNVDKGQVQLHGAVDYFNEQDLAAELAWVPGVTSVTNELTVVRDVTVVREPITISDADLKTIIEHRLMEQPFLGMDDVDVTVSEGVVTLAGVVPSIRTKEAAIREARITNGVMRVHDSIKVQGAPLQTADLHGALHREINANAALADDDITVQVEDTGAVYLSGEVDSFYERNEAVRRVARYPGVTEIVNNLTIAGAQSMTDAELAQAISDELRWSAFVDAEDIAVNVENGVVTLTGTVSDLSEFEAVIDNAYQAGARDVHAKLQLEDGGLIDDDIRVRAKYSYKID